MGKKSTINSLSKIIANVTIHKILLKYTNKPESISHLHYEVTEYRDTAISRAGEFNWNKTDISQIKSKAFQIMKRQIKKRYPDVKFPLIEAKRILLEIINEVI